ncbi:hypothetical protein OV208_15760 [Corallococcus sp. bb12-1]|uniref:hypothetical protein n=1 Tax=Corallococcus sp. bb12-1 TaxID=2996784 RepID=UPI002271E0EE|nr:hypothetical protein [Corallococcus sp. bb12-1]MCY1042781.1 hypothetical protein [Corallococcus sp. bb12-1]
MAPPTSCDPSVDLDWCLVRSSRVQCADGFQMYAYSTPDGWCIERDICKNHRGPVICPNW